MMELLRSSGVLAHQGGWDEILLVLVPIGVIGCLLAVAKRRIDRSHPPRTESPRRSGPPT